MECDRLDTPPFQQRTTPTLVLLAALLGAFGAHAQAFPSGRDFAGRTLTDTNFLGADLTGADFRGAKLEGVMFAQADLTGADFTQATFSDSKKGPTSFVLADLERASFKNAIFQGGVRFEYAELTSADFTGTDLRNVRFGPQLQFDTNSAPPRFSQTRMSCEFPWYWPEVNVEGTSLPSCPNDTPQARVPEPTSVKPPAPANGQPRPRGLTFVDVARVTPMPDVQTSTPPTGSSIYVASSGSDSTTCGSSATSACKTISHGISRCGSQTLPCTVLIGYGKYSPSAPLVIKNQVSLTGGYVGGQPTDYQSTILAPPGGGPAVSANAVGATLSNLIVIGSDSADPSTASTALLAVATKELKIVSSAVHAGTGKSVTVTAAAGTSTAGGKGGGPSGRNGGSGGASACGSTGGNGGTGFDISCDCTGNWASGCKFNMTSCGSGSPFGGTGSGPGSGWGGSPPKYCGYWGDRGPTAGSGSGGSGGSTPTSQAASSTNRLGTFDSAGKWQQAPGNNGPAGGNGGGGGGGAAGAGQCTTHCKIFKHCSVDTYAGTGGGGGGAGGCGASGGKGGAMGGATFGIVLVNSSLQVGSKLTVVGAQGGTGGQGGAGAVGGAGGAGAGGGASAGSGGVGGAGGNSGGGAGGNGGPSVGIVLVGTSSFTEAPTSLYPGASGLPGKGGGGVSGTQAGADGQSGLAQGSVSTGVN
ncbi:MAG: pentapeptide repeat-containing protein [Acidobacteriota bacterium]